VTGLLRELLCAGPIVESGKALNRPVSLSRSPPLTLIASLVDALWSMVALQTCLALYWKAGLSQGARTREAIVAPPNTQLLQTPQTPVEGAHVLRHVCIC
jgi:hypothetical protein